MDELCATEWKAPDLPGHVCNQWRNILVWRLEPVTLNVDILQVDHHLQNGTATDYGWPQIV